MAFHTTTDIILYDEDADYCTIKISPDGDGLGMINVKADNDYFGKINFTMDSEDAVAFANAILRQAAYIKETQ